MANVATAKERRVRSEPLRPEHRLLLRLATTSLKSEAVADVWTLLHETIDWNDLLVTAEAHGVVPLLYRHLHRRFAAAVPETTLDALQKRFYGGVGYNLLRTKELLRLLDVFEAQGVRAFPFKGPVLAASAYGSLSLRPFSDLDIFVDRVQAAHARHLLEAEGYAHLFGDTEERRSYHCGFERGDGLVAVEVHWAMTPPHFPFQLEPAAYWRGLQPVFLAGTPVPGLAPEHRLLMLCTHGTKHLWTRLIWVCDVAESLRATPALDWAAVVAQARSSGTQRMLALGVLLAHQLFGASIPRPLLPLLASRPVDVLASEVRRRLFRRTEPPGVPETYAFYLRASERERDKRRLLRRFFHLLATPTEAEREAIPLPRALGFLHYPLKPLHLLTKRGYSHEPPD